MIGSYERALNLGLDPACFSTPFNGTSLAGFALEIKVGHLWLGVDPAVSTKTSILRTLIAVTLN